MNRSRYKSFADGLFCSSSARSASTSTLASTVGQWAEAKMGFGSFSSFAVQWSNVKKEAMATFDLFNLLSQSQKHQSADVSFTFALAPCEEVETKTVSETFTLSSVLPSYSSSANTSSMSLTSFSSMYLIFVRYNSGSSCSKYYKTKRDVWLVLPCLQTTHCTFLPYSLHA